MRAKLLKEAGKCTDFHLLSSWGAKSNAWTLYPSTKGKAEEAIKGLEFNRVSVYRPGLLMTGREETRTFENAMQSVAGVFDKGNKLSIKCDDLGNAMVFNATKKTLDGKNETLEHADILKLVEPKPIETEAAHDTPAAAKE
jgi:oxidoreductase